MNYTVDDLNAVLKNNPNIKIHGQKPEIQAVEEKKSKYNNKKTIVDGTKFDSIKESQTYPELEMLLKAGQIIGYCRQPEFILQKGTIDTYPICYYADWIVFYPDGTFEIWDDKGIRTDVYKMKKKMFQSRFPKLELIER